MKIHVVYDQQGNIISAGYLDLPTPQAYDLQSPRFGPMAQEGQQIAELEVPEEHAKLGLTDLTERLKVDVKGKQHRLTPKSP